MVNILLGKKFKSKDKHHIWVFWRLFKVKWRHKWHVWQLIHSIPFILDLLLLQTLAWSRSPTFLWFSKVSPESVISITAFYIITIWRSPLLLSINYILNYMFWLKMRCQTFSLCFNFFLLLLMLPVSFKTLYNQFQVWFLCSYNQW